MVSCYPRDGGLLSVDAALAQIHAQIQPLATNVRVSLAAALGRINAADVIAPIDLPGADNSAMDGFAVHHADIAANTVTTLPITQRIIAGTIPAPLARGTVARIFTGAWLPAGADAVVMQEHVTEHDGLAQLRGPVPEQQFVRQRGEDMRAGTIAVAGGTRLDAAHIALLAGLGMAEIDVRPRVRVSIISTGNELAEPGTALSPGRIYNANGALLRALCQQTGAEVIATMSVPDDLPATTELLRRCAAQSDLVLTSGGASVGEEDHIKAALAACGEIALWRIALKPGKPLVFGHIDNVPVLGLPGNPVSAFVTFVLFGRAAIGRMHDASTTAPPSLRLPAAFTWSKPGPRREYARARLCQHHDTSAIALFPDQNSHLISSLTWADGLAVIPENTVIRAGDPVEFVPFRGIA